MGDIFTFSTYNMDGSGVEELYRNYGVLADAKENAGQVC